MRTLCLCAVLFLSGCGELSLVMDYVANKPQTFATSIEGLDIPTLNVFRDDEHPGKLWVEPKAKLRLVANGRQAQFTAMLPTHVEPAYRAAALEALKADPGGICEISGAVPWPDQFAVEFSYVCKVAG